MAKVPKLLAIVPARQGSREVIRKNVRNLGGIPMFVHTVRAIQESGCADQLVISSDDSEIEAWAEIHGVEFLRRPQSLAGAETTIAEVALHVASRYLWEENIGVFQPTSPLRSSQTIRDAYHEFTASTAGSLASVVPEKHLYWYSEDGNIELATPMFKSRVNRQFAGHTVYKETGAIQLVSAAQLTSTKSMVATNHKLFEINVSESDDIDGIADFKKVQLTFNRGLIIFRLEANRSIGTGHLHHCLQLAEGLDHHKIVFLLRNCDEFAWKLIEDRGWDYRIERDLNSDLKKLSNLARKLIINDVLDTSEEEILIEKINGFKIMNIEDLGPGAVHADAVVNALYSDSTGGSKTLKLVGPKYATLRSEFLDLPEKLISQKCTKVLISFGGTDPALLTARVSKLLQNLKDIEIVAILGIGAPDIDPIEGVRIVRNLKSMATEIAGSDLVITAAGRTVFEAAAAGTPVISIAQNAREATHSHLNIESGVIYLGIGSLIADSLIYDSVKMVLGNYVLRQELSKRLSQLTDHFGARRICALAEVLLEGLN